MSGKITSIGKFRNDNRTKLAFTNTVSNIVTRAAYENGVITVDFSLLCSATLPLIISGLKEKIRVIDASVVLTTHLDISGGNTVNVYNRGIASTSYLFAQFVATSFVKRKLVKPSTYSIASAVMETASFTFTGLGASAAGLAGTLILTTVPYA